MRVHFTKICCAFLLLFLASNSIKSAELKDQFDQTLSNLTQKVHSFEEQVKKTNTDEKELVNLQTEIDKVLETIKTLKNDALPHITDLKSQLERLGPAPKKEEPSEQETITQERKRINESLAFFDAIDKKSSLLQTRIDQLNRDILNLKRDGFLKEVFRRYDNSFGIGLIANIADDLKYIKSRMLYSFYDFDIKRVMNFQFLVFFLFIATVWVFLIIVAKKIITKFRTRSDPETDLTVFERTSSVTMVTFARLLPPIIALSFLYLGIKQFGVFNPPLDSLVETLFYALLYLFSSVALAKSILAPNSIEFRLFSLSDKAAQKLVNLITCIALVYCVDLVWSKLNYIINAPISLSIGQSFIASTTLAVLLIFTALTRFKEKDEQQNKVSILWPAWVKLPLWIAAIVILAAVFTGYISLARFIASQIVVSGTVLSAALILHLSINELSSEFRDQESKIGAWTYNTLGLQHSGRHQVAFFGNIALNILLLMIILPLLLFEWGFSFADILKWGSFFFFGFSIGAVQISPAAIILGLLIFVFGLLVTRFVQRWLDRSLLDGAKFESGISTTIRTGVGYVGFIVSALLAVSYAGLDFTNIAIIAGALSVGIGFGLQSIVNNFVSGLILLVERPVKVGDWVIVGDQQGYIRRISVRATEIETFDRSSVIIPNSELITNKVTNWTHGDSVGRLLINVGVAYDSNVKQVYNILKEIGNNHPKSLNSIPAVVVFENFGDSSLDFSLRVYIANIREMLHVETELRMSILEAFQEHKIEIPFPQRDLNLKRK